MTEWIISFFVMLGIMFLVCLIGHLIETSKLFREILIFLGIAGICLFTLYALTDMTRLILFELIW